MVNGKAAAVGPGVEPNFVLSFQHSASGTKYITMTISLTSLSMTLWGHIDQAMLDIFLLIGRVADLEDVRPRLAISGRDWLKPRVL
jgi:hypothetical protein